MAPLNLFNFFRRVARSSNGRTLGSGPSNLGSSPGLAALRKSNLAG